MKQNLIDLHTHSTVSDGLYSPEELVNFASRAGIMAISLTDHDTIDGLDEAAAASKKAGIEFIPGIEIGILHEGEEIHLLGYYLDNYNIIKQELKLQKEERLNRMRAMVNRVLEMGIKITLDEVLAESGNAAPGRMHLARVLVQRRYVHSVNQAFQLYLKKDGPAYIPRKTITLEQSLKLLSNTAKITAIAHPKNINTSLLRQLVDKGLSAIEVFHPEHSRERTDYYKMFAAKNKLLVTGGSDFHGDKDKTVYPTKLAISYSYLEKIKSYIYGDCTFLD